MLQISGIQHKLRLGGISNNYGYTGIIIALLANGNPLVYFSYFLVPVSWIILFKTKIGLFIRSVGENPQTADTVGLNVIKIRYATILLVEH